MNNALAHLQPVAVRHGQEFAPPLNAASGGRLEIVPGASRVTIAGNPALTDLCRIHFDGEAPQVQADAGVVTLRYPRHSGINWLTDLLAANDSVASIALNGAIPWRIEVGGGASQFSANLKALRLEALRIGGGASQVELTLPRPVGVVAVRISGGVSRLTIHRPHGVAARLRVRGGASQLTVDEQYTAVIGGEVRWQNADFLTAMDRYEIEIAGGASDFVFGTW